MNRCWLKSNGSGPKSCSFAVRSITNQSGFVVYATLLIVSIIGSYFAVLIIANRGAVIPMKKQLRKLQAEVNAWSGLSLAQAFVAGYDNQGLSWETGKLVRIPGPAESITLSATHSTGWLDVESRGVFRSDTCTVHGRLGQIPPEIFRCALALSNSDGRVDVADRASVRGDIATTGGMVGTLRSGKFAGKRIKYSDPAFTDSLLESELDLVFKAFHDRENPPVSERQSWDRSPADSNHHGTNQGIWIDSSTTLTSEVAAGSHVWVKGKVLIGGTTHIRRAHIYAAGDITINQNARLEQSTIVSLEDIRLAGNCVVEANVIAAETLDVADFAIIEYPSFLYISSCKARNGHSANAVILIGGKSRVEGTIATGHFGQGVFPKMLISTHNQISGLITTPHPVTLYSHIRGSIHAPSIEYRRGLDIYQNQLFDTEVDYCDLSSMITPLLFRNGVPGYLTCGVTGGW